MLTLSAPVFDISGSEFLAEIEPDGLEDFDVRVSRLRTLDGGAVFNEFGFSESDRTLSIRWPVRDREQTENIVRMAKLYPRLLVSFSGGCFTGAVESFSVSDGKAQLIYLVDRRLDA